MRYVWDAAKDALNLRKYGLSLEEEIPALEDDERESWIDDRFDYEEERIATLGLSPSGLLYVVTTELDEENTRIISVRRAEPHEFRLYGLGRT